ncbi:hypothetical protein CANCADRAFT_3885 [Tortispora caseinolytica NRRL Y-17796]|uniref:Uncharacterized protein n=1 Tax=Tortispora caseinolytica NRRL Y-17796 TaxID=767744 RepID=A0A1E4TBW6_9ASCO|nr:hypothetical protein CANCADRAFT_3885 [Tortispora caseinolytica NRRL Y-17796]
MPPKLPFTPADSPACSSSKPNPQKFASASTPESKPRSFSSRFSNTLSPLTTPTLDSPIRLPQKRSFSQTPTRTGRTKPSTDSPKNRFLHTLKSEVLLEELSELLHASDCQSGFVAHLLEWIKDPDVTTPVTSDSRYTTTLTKTDLLSERVAHATTSDGPVLLVLLTQSLKPAVKLPYSIDLPSEPSLIVDFDGQYVPAYFI